MTRRQGGLWGCVGFAYVVGACVLTFYFAFGLTLAIMAIIELLS